MGRGVHVVVAQIGGSGSRRARELQGAVEILLAARGGVQLGGCPLHVVLPGLFGVEVRRFRGRHMRFLQAQLERRFGGGKAALGEGGVPISKDSRGHGECRRRAPSEVRAYTEVHRSRFPAWCALFAVLVRHPPDLVVRRIAHLKIELVLRRVHSEQPLQPYARLGQNRRRPAFRLKCGRSDIVGHQQERGHVAGRLNELEEVPRVVPAAGCVDSLPVARLSGYFMKLYARRTTDKDEPPWRPDRGVPETAPRCRPM